MPVRSELPSNMFSSPGYRTALDTAQRGHFSTAAAADHGFAAGLRARLSRRNVLQVGSVGMLGLALPALFQSGALAANADGQFPAGLTSDGRTRNCIFIYQYGGLSQLDSWDPKPNAPAEVRGPYSAISTSVPGFQVGELMPQLAVRADKLAVIRSMSHAVPVHDVANRMLLAGKSLPRADAASFGSIVSKLRPSEVNMPSHVWLQKFGGGAMPPEQTYLTGESLGQGYSPLLLGAAADDNPGTPGYRVRVFEPPAEVTLHRLGERQRLLRSLDAVQPEGLHRQKSSLNLDQFQARAFDLLTGPRARSAFDIEQESAALRDRYGRNPLGQNLILARRLIEAGVRLVSVVAWTGKRAEEPFLSIETWDMHGNAGISIFGDGWNGLGYALPRCDTAVSALLDDLEQRGLLDSTLVVLVGEFGRTPKISMGGGAIGRDHWPNCYSAMLAGAGVRGGVVYGNSDQQAAYVKDKPVSPEDFSATVFTALGIDPHSRISPDGFSESASTGQPVTDILA